MRGCGMHENTLDNNLLLESIKSKISEAGGDTGSPLYLDGVSYFETRKSRTGSGSLSINCIFINDEGNVCADLYRTGSAGFFDFICGKEISDLSDRGLTEILYALEKGNWSVEETGEAQSKTGNRGMAGLTLKIPFMRRVFETN